MFATGAIVSVAVNGYGLRYPLCSLSHRRYAGRFGYATMRVTAPKPMAYVEPHDAAWLKLELLMRALNEGAPYVMVLDSDAIIRRGTPRFESVFREGYDVYAARGHSGRWNSGVLIVRNTEESRKLILSITRSWNVPVAEDGLKQWVDWGENGHVIHALDRYDSVYELGREWNNTFDARLECHILHLAGPAAHGREFMATPWRLWQTRLSRWRCLEDVIPNRTERLATLAESGVWRQYGRVANHTVSRRLCRRILGLERVKAKG